MMFKKKSTSRLPNGQGEKAGECQKRMVRAGCNELAEDTYTGDDCLTVAGQCLATFGLLKEDWCSKSVGFFMAPLWHDISGVVLTVPPSMRSW
jgi:hypothetical protein